METADDIVEELGWIPNADRPVTSGARGHAATASVDPLLDVMQAGQAYDLDGLASEMGLDGVRLLPRLLELELHGCVRRIEGGRFMRSI